MRDEPRGSVLLHVSIEALQVLLRLGHVGISLELLNGKLPRRCSPAFLNDLDIVDAMTTDDIAGHYMAGLDETNVCER